MSVSATTVTVKKTFSPLLFFFVSFFMLMSMAQQTVASEIPAESSLEDAWKTLSQKNYNKNTESEKLQ